MNSELFVQIVITLIMFVGIVLSSYVIPWLASKTQGTELAKLYEYAKSAVEWANQTIPAEEWQRKKREVMILVMNYMKDNLKISLSEKDIDVIVEALVNEAKKILKV